MLSPQPNLEQYHSRIEDITDKHMIIAMPMRKGHPVLPQAESSFYGKVFADNAVYQFSSTFLDKGITPFPVWIVSLPRDIKKIQQRSFVRLNTALRVRMTLLSSKDNSDEEPISEVVLTKDISGGGIRLIVKEALPIGTKLKLSFDIPGFGPVQVDGEVIRVEQSTVNLRAYWLGVRFINAHNSVSNKIVKFIFKKQLEQRQKGV